MSDGPSNDDLLTWIFEVVFWIMGLIIEMVILIVVIGMEVTFACITGLIGLAGSLLIGWGNKP